MFTHPGSKHSSAQIFTINQKPITQGRASKEVR
mgnify:CR=1 FL=1